MRPKNLLKIFAFSALVLLIGTLAFLPLTAQEGGSDGPNVAWSGTFFDNPTLTDPSAATGIYNNGLNVNWGPGQPFDDNGTINVGPDNWSARFSTFVTLQAGLYEFVILADDGVRFFINGELLIDNFTANGLTTSTVQANLTGGTYSLLVEYFDQTGDATLQVTWGLAQEAGPTPTPQPLAIGTVVRVRGLAVRTGPYLGASLIAVARPPAQGADRGGIQVEGGYPLSARNTQEGLFTWYFLQYDEDTFGWSSGRYLQIEGNPESLPFENTTPFDVIYEPPGTVLATTRSVMNFRIRPSERVPRVGLVPQIPWGAQVEILARTVQGGRDHWYQVRYRPENSDTDYFGWIYAPFVGINRNTDPIDSVPIL